MDWWFGFILLIEAEWDLRRNLSLGNSVLPFLVSVHAKQPIDLVFVQSHKIELYGDLLLSELPTHRSQRASKFQLEKVEGAVEDPFTLQFQGKASTPLKCHLALPLVLGIVEPT